MNNSVVVPEAELHYEVRGSGPLLVLVGAPIRHVDAGPAVVLGSSGGAVSVLALAQQHLDVVRAVIAHEPPLDRLVDDGDELLAKSEKLMADDLAA
jgi:enterochelin esterase-like enzyme